MKSKKKIIIISAVLVICAIIAAVLLPIRYIMMYRRATDLSTLDYWEISIEYSMLSDELKKVISEEEFYDRTDSGKYNMYRKLEGLELEATDKDIPSTGWWKSPPVDGVETDEGKFWIEYRIDFKAHLNRIEVINFVTYVHTYDDHSHIL